MLMMLILLLVTIYLAICTGLYFKGDTYYPKVKYKSIAFIVPVFWIITLVYTLIHCFESKAQRKALKFMLKDPHITLLVCLFEIEDILIESSARIELAVKAQTIKRTNQIIRDKSVYAYV